MARGPWWEVRELVGEQGLSHKSVTKVVGQLEPCLERDGARVRVAEAEVVRVTGRLGCDEAGHRFLWDAYEPKAQSHATLDSVAPIIAGMPRAVRHLDHVSATAITCVKRALFVVRNWDLSAGEVLCLGDHDLTCIGLAHLCPDLNITVVDIDERVLEYIDGVARERGWAIQNIFADLRVELPRSLAERFDLVFTDPPYTPAGVRLFLKRGLGSLKRVDWARLLLSYGFGERQAGLGLKVQSVLHELRLVNEAVLPHFNRYEGAEAIGSSSELYVCRPTRRSWAAARVEEAEARIYTQGKNAREAVDGALPTTTVEAVERLLGETDEKDITLVGAGWSGAMQGEAVSLGGFLHAMYLARGKPPFTRLPHAGTVAINLHPHYGEYLLRALLAAAAECLILCAPDRSLHGLFAGQVDPGLRELVQSKYRVEVLERGQGDCPALVALEQVPQAQTESVPYILRYLVEHRRARFGNAWREALIAWCGPQGDKVTKNQARQAIAAGGLTSHTQSHLAELPLHALKALAAEVEHSLERLGAADSDTHSH